MNFNMNLLTTKWLIFFTLIIFISGHYIAIQLRSTPYIDTTSIPIERSYEWVNARITCYAPTGYRTASMKTPTNGMIASSDRTIPFDTKVIIDNIEYSVQDRTAKWVHEDFGLTFDIFMKEGCDANFGAKHKLVKIY